MDFMQLAIVQAQKALKKGEVPIGCVIVKNDKVISKGYNARESKRNAILHAEIIAINKACKKLKSWRLDNCEMYVTLEPCQMCMGAIINARIKKVFFGAESTTNLNWKADLIYQKNDDAKNILVDFFKNMR